MKICDEIKKEEQLLARLDRSLALLKIKKRKADTRRKIEYGGLVIKSGMHVFTKDVILGALSYVSNMLEQDPNYISVFESTGQRIFLEKE